MPFKRYHIGNVWRGERPQAGRFREFAQCDFDTIGTDSIASDIETVLVINDLIRAIGFEQFKIRLNNRKVLNGILEKANLAEHSVAVLRALDKLPKIGPEKSPSGNARNYRCSRLVNRPNSNALANLGYQS